MNAAAYVQQIDICLSAFKDYGVHNLTNYFYLPNGYNTEQALFNGVVSPAAQK